MQATPHRNKYTLQTILPETADRGAFDWICKFVTTTFEPLSTETLFYKELLAGDILLFRVLFSVLREGTIPHGDTLTTEHPLVPGGLAFASTLYSIACETKDGNVDNAFVTNAPVHRKSRDQLATLAAISTAKVLVDPWFC